MSDMSFVVNYTRSKVPPSPHALEKHCPTKCVALNFCVVLTHLGGHAIELVQLIEGRPDAVLDGADLADAIDLQRTKLSTDAVPPWK